MHPTIYKLACANCGALSTLPIDILQTKVISQQKININFNEIKWMLLMSSIFALQSFVYDSTKPLKSITLRGALAGLAASPVYTILEYKKIKNRINSCFNFEQFLLWNTIREIILYITLYNIYNLNIKYKSLISALLANGIGYPLKILSFKYGIKNMCITKKTIKINAILEILKSTIGDGISLYLFYL